MLDGDVKYVRSNVFLIIAHAFDENIPISCFKNYDTANKFLKEYELNNKILYEINNLDLDISFEIIEINCIKEVE